ncbi:hypothetical protein FRC14_007828 [Serendipita sp. 396]|nr:hypothetical protein FRC14_007828 [Serendipita sp. 396]
MESWVATHLWNYRESVYLKGNEQAFRKGGWRKMYGTCNDKPSNLVFPRLGLGSRPFISEWNEMILVAEPVARIKLPFHQTCSYQNSHPRLNQVLGACAAHPVLLLVGEHLT